MSHITFEKLGGVTIHGRWRVVSKNGIGLGYIQWNIAWKKYTLRPNSGTEFDAFALQTIELFVRTAQTSLKNNEKKMDTTSVS